MWATSCCSRDMDMDVRISWSGSAGKNGHGCLNSWPRSARKNNMDLRIARPGSARKSGHGCPNFLARLGREKWTWMFEFPGQARLGKVTWISELHGQARSGKMDMSPETKMWFKILSGVRAHVFFGEQNAGSQFFQKLTALFKTDL